MRSEIKLRQHRAIVSASRSRLFAPLLQFEKREIHTVFLRFPNFELGQKSWLSLLVKLCGVALNPGISDTSSRISCAEAHGWRECFVLFPKVGNNEQK